MEDAFVPAADCLGRPFDLGCVVVNFLNVGTTYGKKVLKAGASTRGCN